MKRKCVAIAMIAAMAVGALAGCGGGGGGGNDGGNTGGSGSTSNPPATGSDPLSVTFWPQSISASATPENGGTQATTSVSVTGSKDTLYVAVGSTLHAVAIASLTGAYLDSMQINVNFKEAGSLPNGTYTDTLTFELCKDDQCTQQLAGSPYSVPVTLTVSGSSALAAPVQLAAPTTFLTHDVVDAALSKPLNAVVMASTLPANALQVVDLATGVERTIALSRAPHQLALSPDGLRVAVSHDQMISLVDLTQSAPVVREVAVPATVWQLLLADDDVVQAFATYATSLYTVDMDAGTSLASLPLYAAGKMRARRHPDGNRLYALDGAVSPSNLQRIAMAGDTPTGIAGSSYWGAYPMCDDLWLNAAGDRIVTSCGNVFTSASDPAADLLYAGSLPLTVNTGSYWGNITWLDDSAATGHYALLDQGKCATWGATECNTLLRLINDQTDADAGAWWMPPVYRDGEYRVQHGLFVFHAQDDSLRVIGRLSAMSDATRAYYLVQPTLASGTNSAAAGRARAASARRLAQ